MRLVVGGALLLNISTVLGCGYLYLDLFTCPHPDREHIDPITGQRDPCHELDRDAGTDAGEEDAGEAGVANAGCPEECVPPGTGTETWNAAPLLMWLGPKGQAPPCPPRAPADTYHGSRSLVVPVLSCDSCTCAPSTGSCEIPWGFTAQAALCQTPGEETSFDAPSNWDGSCNGEVAIPANKKCGMPEVACVQSISIDPPTIKEQSCAAATVPIPEKAYYEQEALGCYAPDKVGCDNPSYLCLAASDPYPGGFRHCIYARQEPASEPCPDNYPDGPRTFYHHLTDTRACNCTCGDPAGSKCTAFASVYEDSACTQPLFTNYMITSTDPNACINLPAGAALQSKEIINVSYKPGTCEPKRELVGSVDEFLPFTVCCTSEKVIP